MKKLLFSIASLICAAGTLSAGSASDHLRFGPSHYEAADSLTPPAWGMWRSLSELERSVWNIRHSGDFFAGEARLFLPDLVTDGRSAYLSGLGGGDRAAGLFWRGRRFNNLHSGAAEFQILPPQLASRALLVSPGVLLSELNTTAAVNLDAPAVMPAQPVTFLHHRDGFYDYAPVEFLHARRLSKASGVSFGGYFPKSDGRFEHSAHSGRSLFGEWLWRMDDRSLARVTALTTRNEVQIPFINLTRLSVRDDLDASFRQSGADGWWEAAAWRVGELDKAGVYRAVSRATGARCNGFRRSWFGAVSIASVSAGVQDAGRFDGVELESLLLREWQSGNWDGWASVGARGWAPEQLRLTGGGAVSYQSKPLGRTTLMALQSSAPVSPDMQQGEFRSGRPVNDIWSVWRERPALPVVGRELPVPVSRLVSVSQAADLAAGRLEAMLYHRWDRHPNYWRIEGDSLITADAIPSRRSLGFFANYRWRSGNYDAGISALAQRRTNTNDRVQPTVLPEPDVRFNCDVGWHRSFWGGNFEADLRLSGSYLSAYRDLYKDKWVDAGGAYPLGARATVRIRRFTLYYGLTNWNSFQYDLIPGYRMMHHEEYWGIHWTLFN